MCAIFFKLADYKPPTYFSRSTGDHKPPLPTLADYMHSMRRGKCKAESIPPPVGNPFKMPDFSYYVSKPDFSNCARKRFEHGSFLQHQVPIGVSFSSLENNLSRLPVQKLKKMVVFRDFSLKPDVGIHISRFRDFPLKPEFLSVIVDSGFEHPSEVQHECLPQAILGIDVICQAKSGIGKTAVFVLSTLQQIEPVAGQICHEFERFSTYLPDLKVAVFCGGVNIEIHKDLLKNECSHIVVGTPGRILALARDKDLSLKNVRHFILDECDKILESPGMRRDVEEIFEMTPHDKQVMMFSATLSKEIRPVCKKFMQDPMEIYVDDEAKLTLHELVQHYIKLSVMEKNRKLKDLLDALDFNQVIIFVKSVRSAAELNKLLVECNFSSICIHSSMSQEERLARYKEFKEGHKRILVATDLVGRGIDIERINIVINYDMPDSADTGRFGTKGLAVTFVSSASDSDVLNQGCWV